MLFLLAISAIYTLKEWRQLLVLVTSFTIGHSITMALATFSIIKFDRSLIEFLVPVTILLTCLANFFKLNGAAPKQHPIWSFHNLLALTFGLIHGMGLSGFLKSILRRNEDTWQQLLAFNIGIELGQLLVVSALLLLGFLMMTLFRTKKRDWIMVLSSAVAGISLILIIRNNIF